MALRREIGETQHKPTSGLSDGTRKMGQLGPVHGRMEKVRAWFDDRLSEGFIVPRAELRAGDTFEGPLIVTEYSSTTVMPTGWGMRVHESGALVLRREGS